MDIPGRQSDHLIIGQKNASIIRDIRTYRGANIDFDHHLVKATYRERIANRAKISQESQTEYHLKKPRKETTVTAFQNNIAEVSAEVLPKQKEKVAENQEESEIVEEKWNEIQEAVTEAAKNTIGSKPGKTTKMV